jgi:hypothetical protein
MSGVSGTGSGTRTPLACRPALSYISDRRSCSTCSMPSATEAHGLGAETAVECTQ